MGCGRATHSPTTFVQTARLLRLSIRSQLAPAPRPARGAVIYLGDLTGIEGISAMAAQAVAAIEIH
jgi:hypothetical protein